MQVQDIALIASLLFGVVALIGGVVARDRYIMRQITDQREALRLAFTAADELSRQITKTEVDNLHERLDRTRDEYVRRVDLDGHLTRLDATVTAMAHEVRAQAATTNDRLDKLFIHLSKNTGGSHSISEH